MTDDVGQDLQQEKDTLLFVPCNAPFGAVDSRHKPLLQRHVMERYLARSKRGRRGRIAENAQSKSLLSGCKTTREKAEISYWFFYGHDNIPEEYSNAIHNWVAWPWDMAQDSEPLFAALAVAALRKKAVVTKQRTNDLVWRGRLIRRIQQRLDSVGIDDGTLVAIALLAWLDLTVNEVEVSRVHLRGLSAIELPQSLGEFAWRSIAASDLGLCVNSGLEPIVKCYRRCGTVELDGVASNRIPNLAMRCARLTPGCGTAFNDARRLELFQAMHQVFELWDRLEETTAQLYRHTQDLMYLIQTSRAGVLHATNSARDGAQLVLLICQLAVWAVGRHWIPARESIRVAYVTQALRILNNDSDTDLLRRWHGRTECLLWIVATLGFELQAPQLYQYIQPLARKLLQILQIDTEQRFVNAMQRWPWSPSWHICAVQEFWEAVMCEQPIPGELLELFCPETTMPLRRKGIIVGVMQF